jgi:hypothetical protein
MLGALVLSACATHAGPVLAGASAALVALDQMLASGAIDQSQYLALKGGFDAVDTVRNTVDALKGHQWSTGEVVGGASAGLAAILAGLKAAKDRAVQQVHKERGPITKTP